MRVVLTRDAEHDLKKLSPEIARRVVTKLFWLAEYFEDATLEPLTADLRGFYKLRVGDWRAVYKIEGTQIVVYAVDHRSRVYK